MKKNAEGVYTSNKKIRFAVVIMSICLVLSLTTIGIEANAATQKLIGTEKGVEAALIHAGFKNDQIKNLKVHSENEDGVPAYDVEFIAGGNEYEYSINALNGAILEVDKEKADRTISKTGTSGTSAGTVGKYIGTSKAKEIALKNAGLSTSDVKFTKAKRDKEDGRVVYEVEFISGLYEYEYEISAKTGKIIEKDVERDDDHK